MEGSIIFMVKSKSVQVYEGTGFKTTIVKTEFYPLFTVAYVEAAQLINPVSMETGEEALLDAEVLIGDQLTTEKAIQRHVDIVAEKINRMSKSFTNVKGRIKHSFTHKIKDNVYMTVILEQKQRQVTVEAG